VRRYGSNPPASATQRWVAIAIVVVVLIAMAVWIGVKLSDWPPSPPHEVFRTH